MGEMGEMHVISENRRGEKFFALMVNARTIVIIKTGRLFEWQTWFQISARSKFRHHGCSGNYHYHDNHCRGEKFFAPTNRNTQLIDEIDHPQNPANPANPKNPDTSPFTFQYKTG